MGGEQNERRERASCKGRIKELFSRLVIQTPSSLTTATLTLFLFKRIKQLNKPGLYGYKELHSEDTMNEHQHLHEPRNP